MKKWISSIVGAFMLVVPVIAFASEIDLLTKTLAQKGVISYGEAQTIMTETKESVRREIASGTSESVPAWVQAINLKGDFRLRYQTEKKDGGIRRDRYRYRFRLKGVSSVSEGFQVGFGLATGSDDPRSTNQTLENNFATPDIRLDFAYAKWMVGNGVDIYGGKFANMFKSDASASDLLWDSDINLEGIALCYSQGKTGFFFNLGYFILDEWKSKTSDPYLAAIAPGYNFELSDNASLKIAVSYYSFGAVKGNTLEHSEGGNSLVGATAAVGTTAATAGVLKYDFKCLAPTLVFKLKNVAVVNNLSVFADYVKNSDPSDKNTGYLVGLKIGSSKIKDLGDWQLKYMYRKLEADAWLDTYPDSDAYSGATGTKGSEVILSLGLAKNVSFDIDYYDIQQISSGKHNKIVQFDVLMKF